MYKKVRVWGGLSCQHVRTKFHAKSIVCFSHYYVGTLIYPNSTLQLFHFTTVEGKVMLSLDIWGSEGIAPPFLISALNWDKWSASRPYRFTLGEIALGTHWLGAWVGPRASLNPVEKRKMLHCRDRTRAVQPVTRRYTDWFIPAPILQLY
jgi:hypothetical protein